MTDKADLAALLGSRMCHDLISPIGAIGNGVELLLLDGTSRSPEMALILDSVTHANARIRFFRIAFGSPGQTDHMIATAEVTSILTDITRGTRLSIDWNGPTKIPRKEAKLALLVMMCIENALPHGGNITFDRGESRWMITGTADRIAISPKLWEMLSNPALNPEIGPGQVQFALLRDELTRQGKRLTIEFRENELRFSF